ncbi:hypothetical protein CUMW_251730 [Citrus unshiu]|uniref:Ubiquitin-like protease family profile domain-containing protein n=1 Tax=Citrus unshiu TaxID=55188 RepID=A0A2H5QQC6_CITUN|nr:hypothetical protein CUMW_251730 [Citrus unshiu]
MYFGGVHRKINVKEFDALFKELKFEEMDDMDALKIALFYFTDRVLNARKNHCQINFDWLNEVDDIQYFQNRPWGLVSWEMVYDSLDDALFEKDEKFKTTRLKNPDHNIEKYNLYGFTSGVQVRLDLRSDRRFAVTMSRKIKNKIPRIVQWKPMESSKINFAEVYLLFNNESRIGDVLQTLELNSKESSRKYWLTVKDYMPSILDWVHKHQPSINAMPSVSRQSDELDEHDDIPNPTPEQRHDTSEDEVAVDDHQEQTHADSDDAHDSELFNMFILANGQAPDDYGVYIDVGNQNLSTPTSLYRFYGDVSGESVQVFSEVPPGVNINSLRGLEDSSLFTEFDRCFAGDMIVVRRVQHPRSFFQILLGLTSMGWLGDEVFLNQLWNNEDCAVDSLVFDDRLNSYLCGRQHTMSKSTTDVDMLLIPVNLDGAHWVVARVDFRKNKVWIYDSLLTFRDNKRYKLKFQPLEVTFPR